MGLLNTMETILTVMEDHADLHAQLEPVVLQAVHHIFTNSIMEFYEEAFSLTYDLTTTNISKNMWEMFKLIYQVSIFHMGTEPVLKYLSFTLSSMQCVI